MWFELRLLLQSFLKLQVSERIILLEFSSYKSFFTPCVKIALEGNG